MSNEQRYREKIAKLEKIYEEIGRTGRYGQMGGTESAYFFQGLGLALDILSEPAAPTTKEDVAHMWVGPNREFKLKGLSNEELGSLKAKVEELLNRVPPITACPRCEKPLGDDPVAGDCDGDHSHDAPQPAKSAEGERSAWTHCGKCGLERLLWRTGDKCQHVAPGPAPENRFLKVSAKVNPSGSLTIGPGPTPDGDQRANHTKRGGQNESAEKD